MSYRYPRSRQPRAAWSRPFAGLVFPPCGELAFVISWDVSSICIRRKKSSLYGRSASDIQSLERTRPEATGHFNFLGMHLHCFASRRIYRLEQSFNGNHSTVEKLRNSLGQDCHGCLHHFKLDCTRSPCFLCDCVHTTSMHLSAFRRPVCERAGRHRPVQTGEAAQRPDRGERPQLLLK
jgi:hypothetical protein